MKAKLAYAWWTVLVLGGVSFPMTFIMAKLPDIFPGWLAFVMALTALLSWPALCFVSAGLVRTAPSLARWGMRIVGIGVIVLAGVVVGLSAWHHE